MTEPNERIAEQYKALSSFFMNKIEYDKNLVDKETIESIIDASCEFTQNDNVKTNLLIPDLVHPEKAVSVKFSNINFNLKTALDMILLVPTKTMSNELEIIKFIVGIVKFTVSNAATDIDVPETEIIRKLCLLDYNGEGVSKEKLMSEVNDLDNVKFEAALKKLESINSVQSYYIDEDGITKKMYRITENVVLNIK